MNKLLRIIIYFLLTCSVIIGAFFLYLYIVAIDIPPHPKDNSSLNYKVELPESGLRTIGNNWLRKSKSGMWEMFIEGDAFERGVINGKLSQDLIQEQERAFSEQIDKLVPSNFYKHFLKYFIGWFNRDLDESIPLENKLEIYGVSQSASSEFDYIGSAYQRMMNYHAAHDIGHALQNLALVGCSSFATWDEKSKDNKLIVGRNFDFYVGDRFAKNKIVLFVNPSKGHKFMMVTWGGMTGVVSGMNMEGLTITLNAAKSAIPSASATPVSILAREILQYATNIDEAVKIATSRKTFVSESFLIASAKDHKAVSIEITPDTLAVYDTHENYIICTNHYESNVLGNTPINKQHKIESASGYRFQHIKQLLDSTHENTPASTASILRNQLGLNNKFIGYGNEKSINQLICHHSIIFNPDDKIVWVSTDPWQLGAYVAYRLEDIFSMNGMKVNHETNDSTLTIPPDTFLLSKDYRNYVEFRKLKLQITEGTKVDPQELIKLNPEYYDAYKLAGDFYFKNEQFTEALTSYQMAITKEIASVSEKNHILEMIENCKHQQVAK